MARNGIPVLEWQRTGRGEQLVLAVNIEADDTGYWVIYNGTGSGKIAEGKAPGGQAGAKAAALAHVSIAIADAAREAK